MGVAFQELSVSSDSGQVAAVLAGRGFSDEAVKRMLAMDGAERMEQRAPAVETATDVLAYANGPDAGDVPAQRPC